MFARAARGRVQRCSWRRGPKQRACGGEPGCRVPPRIVASRYIASLGPPNSAVESLLARARALVFPSLWHETLGPVVLETLSKGVPVICSRGTGAADWVEAGVERVPLEPGDLAGLVARLRQLAEDDDLAARLGAEAYRRYWQDAPTIEAHTARLERVYDVILDGPGSRQRRHRRLGGRVRVPAQSTPGGSSDG